ncbi:glycosyltransferase family 1 protein [Candidatus Gracilibacteria bacterium]|nr:glycosyltransferase family 1 protein [Candidatus Gracilibacteria bacterium]NJM86309.1 glycosyltransferase family 1 protein [Hydrococcus sp. RU_2_2]
MKIAIITSGFLPVIDGVTVSGLHRLHKLSQWGHEVLLFCPDYSTLANIYPNWQDYTGNILSGVTIVNLESTAFMDIDFERNVSKNSYKVVLQELEKFEPDIIHVDEPERLFVGFWRIPGIDYAKQNHIPCVAFFRTNFLEYLDDYFSFPIGEKTIPLPVEGMVLVKFLFKKFLSWVYNAYDATLIHNIFTHQKLVEIGIKNTIYENLNGFDPNQFFPNLRQENFFENKYGLVDCDRKIKLIFLGRLTPDKGWKFTIDAFSEIIQNINPEQLALIIVGDGPMRDEISSALKPIFPHIHFFGRVAPSEVPAILANSDIYVTTSEKENRALTIIEALASGLPILAPRAGGIPQDIRDGWNGFLFEPQNIEEFSNKLKLLTENSTLRQEMGLKGRQYIEKYSWDITVKSLIRLWEEQIIQNSQLTNKVLRQKRIASIG